jgi:hypothetical protein
MTPLMSAERMLMERSHIQGTAGAWPDTARSTPPHASPRSACPVTVEARAIFALTRGSSNSDQLALLRGWMLVPSKVGAKIVSPSGKSACQVTLGQAATRAAGVLQIAYMRSNG